MKCNKKSIYVPGESHAFIRHLPEPIEVNFESTWNWGLSAIECLDKPANVTIPKFDDHPLSKALDLLQPEKPKGEFVTVRECMDVMPCLAEFSGVAALFNVAVLEIESQEFQAQVYISFDEYVQFMRVFSSADYSSDRACKDSFKEVMKSWKSHWDSVNFSLEASCDTVKILKRRVEKECADAVRCSKRNAVAKDDTIKENHVKNPINDAQSLIRKKPVNDVQSLLKRK